MSKVAGYHMAHTCPPKRKLIEILVNKNNKKSKRKFHRLDMSKPDWSVK